MDNKRRSVRENTARLRRNLLTVRRCNHALFQARSEQGALQSICEILVETAQVDLAWIGYCEDDPERTVRPVASAGSGSDYLERVHHSWDPGCGGQGPVGEAIRTAKSCWVKDIRTAQAFSHRAEVLALGYESCVALPLVVDTPGGDRLDLRGALTVYARTPVSFDESTVEVLTELASNLACRIGRVRSHMADDLGQGVRALLIRGERKRVEEALRSSESRLRLVIDTIPTVAWSALPDGSCDFVNKRWSEYTGMPLEDAIGSGWQAAFHPEDIDTHVDKWRASLASAQPLEIEARLRGASDGEYRSFLVHGVPLRDESGHVVRWYGTATDIEGRKRAEQALRRSEAYLADSQRMSHTGSWAFDAAHRRIIHSSKEHNRLFGFGPATNVPTWDEWVQRLHPEDRERTLETIEQKIRERADAEFDCRIVHPDGTIKYLHAIGHPVLNSSGNVVEFAGTSIDVTDRKQAEEARLEAQNKLAHVNRVATMGQLTASIAHEVRQPIAAIVINAQTALRFLGAGQSDASEMQQILDGIVKDGNRASEIVGRIRDLVKKMPPRKGRLDMNEAIIEVVALTRNETAKSGVSLNTNLAKSLPRIQGDRIQLQQVLLNLIINALEAMSAQSATPRDLLIVTDADGSSGVRVAVADSGPGLDDIDHLFDAFYTTKSGGMGMGLAICRSIIETHGGRIWATPNSPRGAIFHFTVPGTRA